MCKLRVAIGGFLLVGAMQSTHASDVDLGVFGVRLGEPLTLPECAFNKRYGRLSYEIASYKNPPPDCWKRNMLGTPGTPLQGNETIIVQFRSLPFGFEAGDPTIKLIEGRVEEFRFTTVGGAQRDVFDALAKKYGTPVSHDVQQVQNRMGASFASITAHWSFPNLSVLYLGLSSTVDKGVLVISSSKANQAEQERIEEQKAAERQL